MRDMFPKEMVNDVRGLLKKGLELKKGGKSASYKVIARGPGLIPVLEVRKRGPSGQLLRWEIYKQEESSKELSKTEENKKKKVEDIGTFCGRAEEENWSPATCHNKLSERYAGLSPTTRIKERVNDIVYTRSVGSRLQDSEKRIVKS